MNVYDQAHGLAQAIKSSEEFKRYDELKKKVAANQDLANMLKDFQKKQFELQAKQMMGGDGCSTVPLWDNGRRSSLRRISSGRDALFTNDERRI